MRPFQGYGHFCTGCGHTEGTHTLELHHCHNGSCIESKGCVMPGCGCNYYYEGGDG